MSRTRKSAAHSFQHRPKHSPGMRTFLLFLACVAGLYATILAINSRFGGQSPAGSESWLARCRQICRRYGLVPTGHVANDAAAYLALAKPHTFIAPLTEILGDTEFYPVQSEPHELLGSPAPDFQLPNDHGELVSLRELNRDGPVVVVFYYGYGCSHCVAQLFGLQKDLEYFRELGAQVVAISPDSSEHTAQRYAEYGRFDFPVVSDVDNSVARQWGVFIPRIAETDEDRVHGTFLVDQSGRVIFASRGYQPFLDNKSLLFWLAGQRTAPAATEKNPTPQTSEVKP